jgi:hypothetical protein
LEVQLTAYRRLRETLRREIKLNLLFAGRLAVLPQRK